MNSVGRLPVRKVELVRRVMLVRNLKTVHAVDLARWLPLARKVRVRATNRCRFGADFAGYKKAAARQFRIRRRKLEEARARGGRGAGADRRRAKVA